jgi:hypothetical protein
MEGDKHMTHRLHFDYINLIDGPDGVSPRMCMEESCLKPATKSLLVMLVADPLVYSRIETCDHHLEHIRGLLLLKGGVPVKEVV